MQDDARTVRTHCKAPAQVVLLTAILLLILLPCSYAVAQETPLSPGEAHTLIRKGADGVPPVILDIRTGAEFAMGHLPGAMHINFYADDFEQRLSRLDPTKPYLVYCHSGNRSMRAMEIFTRLGFTRIYHLTTGIAGWNREALPLER